MHGVGPGVHCLSGQVITPFPPALPPSVSDVVVTITQIQGSTTSPQLPWPKLSLSPPGGTMPTHVTKIAAPCRWNDDYVPFVGQDHVTVCSRARIETRIDRGTITITTMPVSATRNRVRRLPLANAPGGEGQSDEGPSDGPPRRRQRALDSCLASLPASSAGSETTEVD